MAQFIATQEGDWHVASTWAFFFGGDVLGVNQGTKTFTLGYVGGVAAGDVLTITGSTGNDGQYTVVSFDLDLDTVTVSEAIPDATVDGTASLSHGVPGAADTAQLQVNVSAGADITCVEIDLAGYTLSDTNQFTVNADVTDSTASGQSEVYSAAINGDVTNVLVNGINDAVAIDGTCTDAAVYTGGSMILISGDVVDTGAIDWSVTKSLSAYYQGLNMEVSGSVSCASLAPGAAALFIDVGWGDLVVGGDMLMAGTAGTNSGNLAVGGNLTIAPAQYPTTVTAGYAVSVTGDIGIEVLFHYVYLSFPDLQAANVTVRHTGGQHYGGLWCHGAMPTASAAGRITADGGMLGYESDSGVWISLVCDEFELTSGGSGICQDRGATWFSDVAVEARALIVDSLRDLARIAGLHDGSLFSVIGGITPASLYVGEVIQIDGVDWEVGGGAAPRRVRRMLEVG